MKPIVFDTVIDGKPYVFKVTGTILISPSDKYLCETIPSVYGGFAFGRSEEDAILKLVKLIEK